MPTANPPSETFRFAPPYELPSFEFVAPPDIGRAGAKRYPVVIVGAGPAGLTLACDLAQRGIRAVLLDEDDTVGVRGASSRGICYAQKSLEIFDRLGIAERIVDKGVTWSAGTTYSGDSPVYSFNLKSTSVSAQPPFVNLQQFYLEWFLVDRVVALGHTDLRWKNRLTGVDSHADHVRLSVDTPAGSYELEADYLIDATGANSPIRQALGLDAHASRSADRWCISDVRFSKPLPMERWTWVDAPFNDGRAVWQHLMADAVWRVDYQMAEGADPDVISRPEVAGQRLRKQLGPDVDFEFVWIGPYQYRDHLLDRFRSDRVIFIGDAAHVVSPFGARGGNSGIQDAANLGWKLALVLQGQASDTLLDSYDAERQPTARENLEVTSRTARFMAPRSNAEHTLRRAAVDLARRFEFARPLINTGRMSVANDYPPSAWLPAGGTTVQNQPLVFSDGRTGCLMDLLRDQTRFVAFWFEPSRLDAEALREQVGRWPLTIVAVGGDSGLPTLVDGGGVLAKQLLGPAPGAAASTSAGRADHADTVALVRPDAYLAAVIHHATPASLSAALATALGSSLPARSASHRPAAAAGDDRTAGVSAGISVDTDAGISSSTADAVVSP
ncbi:MAG: FAD-binding monooxygenase [Rhizobacter sp.]|nr:FAD-binding monooxygenase [Rhizobacter sp.]